LGLNEVVPYRPERQRLTVQDFLLRRAILRLEDGAPAVDDAECDGGSSVSSKPSRASSFRRMLPSRWS